MPTGHRSEQNATRALLVIVVAGALLRAVVAWLTIDIPGDGPTRAIYAYRWSLSPELIRSGIWLPALTYLAGALNILIPDPLTVPSLINVTLGSASIPLLYAVTRRMHGAVVGLAAAALLAILPLHVGLSTSSLSEAGFVFAMLGVLWSAFGAAERNGSKWCLALLAFFGVFGEMLRYEAWVLLPIVVAYVAHQRRSFPAALGLTAILLCFPVFWSLGNYAKSGDALLGFTSAITDPNTMDPVPPHVAALLIGRGARRQLGDLAPVILVLGVLHAAVAVARRKARPEQVLHFALVAMAWAMLSSLAMRMGSHLWGRYLILAIVLALPLATGWMRSLVPGWRSVAGLAALCVLSFAFAQVAYHPNLFVTRHHPVEIQELATWLAGSEYRDDAIVLTRLGWRSGFVKLYRPALLDRSLVVSNYLSDEGLRNFLRSRRPTLLVTGPGDDVPRERVERALGTAVTNKQPVKTIRDLVVFDIRPK